MTSKKAIKILKNHVYWFLSRTGKYIYVSSEDRKDLLDACQIATDALRKTIPVQPVPESDWPGWVVRCPTCRSRVYDSDWDNDTNRERHRNICIYCGQRFTKPSDTAGCWEDIKNRKEKRNRK